MKKKYFVKNKNVFTKNNSFVESKNFSWSIDTLFDLKYCEWILKNKAKFYIIKNFILIKLYIF